MKLDVYKIKCFMAEKKFTQKTLAKEMNVMPNTLSMALCKERGTTSLVGKLAHALGTTAEEITVKE